MNGELASARPHVPTRPNTPPPFLVVAHEADEGKVQSSRLAKNGSQGKLETYATGDTARPHFEARMCIGSFNGPRNGIIPNVHETVPANECPVKERHVHQDGRKDQPVNQHNGQSEHNKTNAQSHQKSVGRISETMTTTQKNGSANHSILHFTSKTYKATITRVNIPQTHKQSEHEDGRCNGGAKS